MVSKFEQNFLDLLVKKKYLDEKKKEEVKNEADVKKISITKVLQDKGILDSEDMARVQAESTGMPYEDVSDVEVPEQILNIIPFDVAENYRVICFDRDGNILKLGITDPYNFKAVEAVNFLARKEGRDTEFYIISQENFKKIFEQYQNLEKEISSALEIKEEEGGEEGGDLIQLGEEGEEGSGDDDIHSAPVAKMVSVIIRHAVDGRASDIHIEPMDSEVRVRYRIDGILRTSLTLPRKVHGAIVGRIKVLAKLKLDETRVPQDGRIRLLIGNDKIDFRVSTMPLLRGEKVEMRILNLGQKIPDLEELGFAESDLDIIKKNIQKTHGIFLITGPTGSGKSTTLASILNILNKEGVNISTLEDPIEYYLKGTNQSQVRPDIKYTFATGLRSLLRQDPDILMVGEIRDNETALLCIHAGLTGHGVFSTLHTNTSLGAIPRLFDMEIEPFLLGSTLHTVVAQRLVRKICPKCKEKKDTSDAERKRVDEILGEIPDKILQKRLPDYSREKGIQADFYFGKGCNHCGGLGYMERTVITEVLDINKEVKEMIINGKKRITVDEVKKTQPFTTLRQDGIIKAIKGLTTIEEVLRVAQ